MLSKNDKDRIRDTIDFLCRRELTAKGMQPFFKDGVIDRVFQTVALPMKHDEFMDDVYRKYIGQRLTAIMSKKHEGIRIWICDKSARNRWQNIRGVTPSRLRSMIHQLDYLGASISVSYSCHADLYEQVKAMGVADDQPIGDALDGFAPRPITNRRVA